MAEVPRMPGRCAVGSGKEVDLDLCCQISIHRPESMIRMELGTFELTLTIIHDEDTES